MNTMMDMSLFQRYLISEFLSSLVFFSLFFSLPSLFGYSYLGWIAHFCTVFIFDGITSGAIGNPIIALAFYSIGESLQITAARICAEIMGGLISFKMMRIVLPKIITSHIYCPNPVYGLSVLGAMKSECIASFILVLAILIIIHISANKYSILAMIAVTVRFMIIFGTYTGPGMNPMIGIACWSEKELRSPYVASSDYLLIYCAAPVLGALVACYAWPYIKHGFTTMKMLLNSRSKMKEKCANDWNPC